MEKHKENKGKNRIRWVPSLLRYHEGNKQRSQSGPSASTTNNNASSSTSTSNNEATSMRSRIKDKKMQRWKNCGLRNSDSPKNVADFHEENNRYDVRELEPVRLFNAQHDNASYGKESLVPNTLVGIEELSLGCFAMTDEFTIEDTVSHAIQQSIEKEHTNIWIPNSLSNSKQWMEYLNSSKSMSRGLSGSRQNELRLQIIAMRYVWEQNYEKALEAFEYLLNNIEYDDECSQSNMANENNSLMKVGQILHNMAVVHMRAGNYNVYDLFQEAALTKKDALGTEIDPTVVSSLVEMGVSLFAQSQIQDNEKDTNALLEKALAVFKETFRIGNKIYGEKHFFVTTALNNIACVEFALDSETYDDDDDIDHGNKLTGCVNSEQKTKINHDKKAIQACNDSLSILRAMYIQNYKLECDGDQVLLKAANTLVNMGFIHINMNNENQAYEAIEEALMVYKTILGKTHELTITTSNKLFMLAAFFEVSENDDDKSRKQCESDASLLLGSDCDGDHESSIHAMYSEDTLETCNTCTRNSEIRMKNILNRTGYDLSELTEEQKSNLWDFVNLATVQEEGYD